MSDWSRGWTQVGRADPSQTYGRFWELERENYERKSIASWDNDDNWPGIDGAKFTVAEANRFDTKLVSHRDLGDGGFGRVDEVTYGTVRLARKRIRRRARDTTIDELRQEGLTMKKLDHHHVVKLVATYVPRAHQLCLLIWPVAVCNLSDLLDDLENLRLGLGDRQDILERLHALDIEDLTAIETSNSETQDLERDVRCPLEYLRNVIGCVSRAMAHCHANDVRHLDIKPSNILLKAGRVYLADFGISRDVSGQDLTTTEGQPGTLKWRAPELYMDHGSSMQLSDIYSLGLVFLNIATVLYNVRLAEFDEALKYPLRQTRQEELLAREEKLNAHLEKLTSHAHATSPFLFTYDGQETVRARPVVNLISKMITSNPRNRLSARKIDEKLSMLGGIQQIYHGECCKQPMSWVEDKWDRKFASFEVLRKENERQKKRIAELEGRDQTYELRLEHERKKHEETISNLRQKLKEAEEKYRQLEIDTIDKKRNPGRSHGQSRPTLPRANRSSTGPGSPLPASLFRLSPKPQSTPSTPAARPPMPQHSRSAQRFSIDARSQSPLVHQSTFPPRLGGDAPSPRAIDRTCRTPSFTDLTVGSKLPLRVSTSRSETPNLNRDQSLTDSSMSSSIFSRKSFETTPTPAQNSPAIGSESTPKDGSKEPQWGRLPEKPAPPVRRPVTPEQPSLPSEPCSPAPSYPLSVMSSPRTLRSDLASENGDLTRVRVPPSLQSMKSWAEVANEGRRSRASRASTGPRAPSTVSNRSTQQVPVS